MTIRELLKAWENDAEKRGIMDKKIHTVTGSEAFLVFADNEDGEKSEAMLFMFKKEDGSYEKAYITSMYETEL